SLPYSVHHSCAVRRAHSSVSSLVGSSKPELNTFTAVSPSAYTLNVFPPRHSILNGPSLSTVVMSFILPCVYGSVSALGAAYFSSTPSATLAGLALMVRHALSRVAPWALALAGLPVSGDHAGFGRSARATPWRPRRARWVRRRRAWRGG